MPPTAYFAINRALFRRGTAAAAAKMFFDGGRAPCPIDGLIVASLSRLAFFTQTTMKNFDFPLFPAPSLLWC